MMYLTPSVLADLDDFLPADLGGGLLRQEVGHLVLGNRDGSGAGRCARRRPGPHPPAGPPPAPCSDLRARGDHLHQQQAHDRAVAFGDVPLEGDAADSSPPISTSSCII